MHRFDTPTPPTLRVEFRAGDITIEGKDTTETTVELTGRRDDDAAREILAQAVVEQRGDLVVVDVPKRRSGLRRTPELDLRIVAPRDSVLAVKTESGDLSTHGSLGGGRVDSGSGDVTVTHLTGPLRVRAGSGDVRIDSTEADLDVQTGSGDVEVGSISSSAALQAGSGDVTVEHVAGALRVQTGSGDVVVREAEQDVIAQAGSGDVLLHRVHRGRAKVTAASGDIHVGLARGTVALLEVQTLTGRVDSDLEAGDEPGSDEQRARLQLNTVSGDITVVRA